MLWRWDQVLKTHPNGMRFACFGEEGELLAVNEYFRRVCIKLLRASTLSRILLTYCTAALAEALLSMRKLKVSHTRDPSKFLP
jgi:hypothetical protein